MTNVDDVQKLITMKLMESGQLMKMQAMVIEASLKSLNEDAETEEEQEQLFYRSPQLKVELASAEGNLRLSLVKDYLSSLGLLHSANVLDLECNLSKLAKEGKLTSRGEMAKKFGANAGDEHAPVLVSALQKGTGGAPAGTTAAAAAKSPEKKGASLSKDDVSASVQAVLNKAQPQAAAAPQNPKSKDTPYWISNWDDKEFERNGAVEGQQVAIEDLKRCKVFVYDAVDSITMDACEDCTLVVAACEGSIFIRECKNVKIIVACKQLRFRDTSNCDVFLFASTDPVVEMSHNINFYPFNAKLPKLGEKMKKCRLDPAQNRFVHVYDFTEDEPSLPQPHFTIKYPNHGGLKLQSFGDHIGTPEAPPEIQMLLDGKLEPAASSESKNKSHNIKTGGKVWNESSAAQEEPVAVTKAPAVSAPANTLSRDSDSDSASYSSFDDDDDDEF